MKIEAIGTVHTLSDSESLLKLRPEYKEGLCGIATGDQLEILYWMHKLPTAERRTLMVHPQGNRARPKQGVFSLRSPMRPNPIGVSTVRVSRVEENKLFVTGLDAFDGSPIVDVKISPPCSAATPLTNVWGKMHNGIISLLEDHYGRRFVRELLYLPIWELGLGAAEDRRAEDAEAIGHEIMRFEEHFAVQGQILETGSDSFVREITKCPWSYFCPLGCNVFAWWMEGFCQGLNRDYEYRLEKLAAEGNKACVWSVRRRSREPGTDGSQP